MVDAFVVDGVDVSLLSIDSNKYAVIDNNGSLLDINTLEIYDFDLQKSEFFKVIRKNKDSEINGFIIEFSVNELKVLDCYESDHYKRKEIIDQYGNKFWVYCENELWYEGSA